MKKNYEEEYHKHSHQNLLEDEEYYRARAEISKLLYFNEVSDDDVILDFGCGIGQHIFFMPNAFGYDASKFAMLECAKKGSKLIMDPSFYKEKFDVVFSRHVLEHVDNPLKTLDTMKQCLRPGGKLILVLPIERQQFVKIEETQNQHIFGWNFQTINNLLFKAGFQPVDNEYCRGAGYNKLLPLYRKSFKLYRFFTYLASFWSGSKEMKITAVRRGGNKNGR